MKRSTGWGGLFVVLALGTRAGAAEGRHRPAVDVPVIDITGWAREISLSAQRAAEDYRRRFRHDPVLSLAAGALREGFAPGRFEDVAGRAFDERASSLAWNDIRRWLGSPLAGRMESAERRARSEETLLAYEAWLEKTPPSSTRRELVERLDRASGMSDVALELQVKMMEALVFGINQSLPSQRQRGEREIQLSITRVRDELTPRTRERILLTLFYAYEGVSDDELREYVRFLESETGRSLNQVLLESLLVAMSDASQRASEIVSARAKDFGRKRI